MTEEEAYDTLFGVLCDSKDAHYEAVSKAPSPIDWNKIPKVYEVEGYATLTRSLLDIGNFGWPEGTRVRICHVSNLGLIGITDDLKLERYHSYKFRFLPGEGWLKDIEVVL